MNALSLLLQTEPAKNSGGGISPVVWIVLGAVVLAVLAFFLRGKGTPEAKQPKLEEAPKAAPEAPAKKEAPRKTGDAPSRPTVPVAELAPDQTAGDGAVTKEIKVVEVPQEAKESLPPSQGVRKPTLRPVRDEVSALKQGLTASRKGFMARIADLFKGKKEIDAAIFAELEEVMLTSDVGPKATHAILERLKEKLERKELADSDAVWAALRREALDILKRAASPKLSLGHKPTVVLMVGVNGVGKTTTIGKLATKLGLEGRRVMLAAGDTFRAAAVAQLEVWGQRVGAEVIKGKEGADPASVAFEGVTKAKEQGVDVLFVDTAGRLHTKTPLMDEIKKVRRSIDKSFEGAPHETLLVLDATTGQNALNQAALFKEAVDLTGIVLTKLDGTAKGGIVLAISDELNLPVKYIGLGEKAEDLREFAPDDFVEALFARDA
ncbi:MAG: signal recognition particle-docking protein FtsY [Polyangiaceae bacterium]